MDAQGLTSRFVRTLKRLVLLLLVAAVACGIWQAYAPWWLSRGAIHVG